MLTQAHLDQLAFDGWARIEAAVPTSLCDDLVFALVRELGVPVDDPSRWNENRGGRGDLIPVWGHQTQWNIRQHPSMHAIWSRLRGTSNLLVSLDSCRFTPPWQPDHPGEMPIHWDHDPWDSSCDMIQGVLALTDTGADQGGFRCVPDVYRTREKWPQRPTQMPDGTKEWVIAPDATLIKHVGADAGDLIVWNYRLPHSNSRNLSSQPRLAFYLQMSEASDEAMRKANVESWRTGYCVPCWRDRPGYDRAESWPPAALSPLGYRLLGLDSW